MPNSPSWLFLPLQRWDNILPNVILITHFVATLWQKFHFAKKLNRWSAAVYLISWHLTAFSQLSIKCNSLNLLADMQTNTIMLSVNFISRLSLWIESFIFLLNHTFSVIS